MNTPGDNSLTLFLADPTRFLFFTGKGGVGKTSLACASAIHLADRRKRVLLISTDPASNLDEVLGVRLNPTPTRVPGVEGLQALNIDPAAAAAAYREKMVGPYRDKLPEAIVRAMEEQFSGACTMEIAAFDEFSRLLGLSEATADYDYVIFDTAPTGHTLRLLSLPGAWTGYLENSLTGNSCLGPLSGLEKQRTVYHQAVATLADSGLTTLVLVSRAERSALAEAERTCHELSAIGVRKQHIILNGLFHARGSDPVALALQNRGESALWSAASFLKTKDITKIRLRSHNLIGIPLLRALFSPEPSVPIQSSGMGNQPKLPETDTLSRLVDGIEADGAGVVMTMGKGGVGKTTIAAAIATELVRRGHKVRLSTTDPAAHIAAAAGQMSGLEIHRIDPRGETANYVSDVLSTVGEKLGAPARALLEEDLHSPCTEEIAVFRAFARIVEEGTKSFVVLDTAPTGHTVLLLDATESYHREVARKTSGVPEEVRNLLPRLRNPKFTKVLVVTIPEATPVHEAEMLQADLRRAQIEPFAWVINQSFAKSHTNDPLLAVRGYGELPFIREVVERLSKRTALVPWMCDEPVGPDHLQRMFLQTGDLP